MVLKFVGNDTMNLLAHVNIRLNYRQTVFVSLLTI